MKKNTSGQTGVPVTLGTTDNFGRCSPFHGCIRSNEAFMRGTRDLGLRLLPELGWKEQSEETLRTGGSLLQERTLLDGYDETEDSLGNIERKVVLLDAERKVILPDGAVFVQTV